MNNGISYWNIGLLFAGLTVIFGTVGLVSTATDRDREFSSGLVMQGVMLMFVAGGGYFQGAVDLRLGAIAIVGLLIVQSLRASGPEVDTPTSGKDDPT